MNSEQPEGREALIHLHVPAALKARWVRDSRAAGMRLTDWIISKLERPAMNVFKVPQTGPLADKYHGSGYALVATVAGQLVDLVYLADALPEFDAPIIWACAIDSNGSAGQPAAGGVRSSTRLVAALNDQRLAPSVRRLQALGEVHVGMLSCWEFCEL